MLPYRSLLSFGTHRPVWGPWPVAWKIGSMYWFCLWQILVKYWKDFQQILENHLACIPLSEIRFLSHKEGARAWVRYVANIVAILDKHWINIGQILDKYWKSIEQVMERHTIYFFWSMTFCPTALLPFPKWATTLKKLCQVEIVTIIVQKWTQKWNSSKDYECNNLHVSRDVGNTLVVVVPFEKYDIQKCAGLKRYIGNTYWWESIFWQIQGNFCKAKITITAEVSQLLSKIDPLLTKSAFDQV